MPPETAKLLLDMKLAAARISRFVAGKKYEDYLSDELLRSEEWSGNSRLLVKR